MPRPCGGGRGGRIAARFDVRNHTPSHAGKKSRFQQAIKYGGQKENPIERKWRRPPWCRPRRNPIMTDWLCLFRHRAKAGVNTGVFFDCRTRRSSTGAALRLMFDRRPTTRIEKAAGNRGAVLNKKPRFPVAFCFPHPVEIAESGACRWGLFA